MRVNQFLSHYQMWKNVMKPHSEISVFVPCNGNAILLFYFSLYGYRKYKNQ